MNIGPIRHLVFPTAQLPVIKTISVVLSNTARVGHKRRRPDWRHKVSFPRMVGPRGRSRHAQGSGYERRGRRWGAFSVVARVWVARCIGQMPSGYSNLEVLTLVRYREDGGCNHCGEHFVKRRYWQRFCSAVCRNAWHQEQRTKAMRAYRGVGLNEA